MITIIVSSYKPDLYLQFSQNVANTIGVDYEIIKIDNPGLMGLCAAYNTGILRAKYEILCFSHEDIIFHTNNWGEKLIQTFQSDATIGMVGVVGSSYKSFLPSGWAPAQETKFIKVNMLQVINGHPCIFKDKEKGNPNVVTLDGCWFVTKREVVEKYKFDENTFKGYHCYDIDFCLNIGLHYKLIVHHDILVEHLSLGSFDQNWMTETVKLHNKWKDLPRNSEPITDKEILNQEYLSLYEWLKRMKQNKNSNIFYIFSLVLSNRFRKVLGFKNWIYFPIYTFTQLLKSKIL